MEIIAHRGFWKKPEEKNSRDAIYRAFDFQFGIETDIRDYKGELVISHNVADEESILLEEVLKEYSDNRNRLCLALNVKADGIQDLLIPLLQKYQVNNYFLFDMSIPELVVNHAKELSFFTRQSDIEEQCVMYEQSAGVWLDSFFSEKWLTKEVIEYHILHKKKICIVSPELHGKPYTKLWDMIRNNGYHHSELVMLCTDVPDIAKEFFHE